MNSNNTKQDRPECHAEWYENEGDNSMESASSTTTVKLNVMVGSELKAEIIMIDVPVNECVKGHIHIADIELTEILTTLIEGLKRKLWS